MSRQQKEDIRFLALEAIIEIMENGRFSHHITEPLLEKYAYLDTRDKRLLLRLITGTVERAITLDYMIDRVAKTPAKKQRPAIRNLLRMSIYQLYYMDKIPARAVCHEAGRLCARKGFAGLKGFVNGVLRGFLRLAEADNGGSAIVWPSERDRLLSVKYSMPLWIVRRWLSVYTGEETERMLASFYGQRPLTIRLNRSRAKKEDLFRALEAQGAHIEAHPFGEEAYYLDGFESLTKMSAFRDGLFSVQDASSMLVGRLAMLQGGEHVLDLCAAPGGKSCHIAEMLRCLPGEGTVLACDLSPWKVERIRENIARLHLDNVTAEQSDARQYKEGFSDRFDVVVADLPCSGLGVPGRKPDLKYRVRESDIDGLSALQAEILDVSAPYVKENGLLIYSTCTIEPEENRENVRRFMSMHPEFKPVDISRVLPACVTECEYMRQGSKEGYVQLLPGQYPCDGFFIAVLRKTNSLEK